MYRKAALLLFALACVAPLAFAAGDEELLDAPLFKGEELVSEPQRALLTTTSNPPTYTPCKPGRDYEIYFVAHKGLKTKRGVPKWGLTRDRLWAPSLKHAAQVNMLPWKFPVTNYSRCVFQKTKRFTKLQFHARIVCNLTDVPCKRRPGVRKAFRNAAKIKASAFVVATNY